MIYQTILGVGQKLFQMGLNHSNSGNISVREGDTIMITRSGACLDNLEQKDIIYVGIEPDSERDKLASMELIVHRAIYNYNSAINAIVHAHCPFSIVQAHESPNIMPYDDEGKYYFSEGIPVMQVSETLASKQVATSMNEYVHKFNSVIVARHGVFSWGASLKEATHYLSVVESVAKINYLLETKRAT